MGETIYSKKVIASISDNPMKQEIISREIGTDGLKQVVNRLAQQANRRMQNIKNAKIASPAYKAVIAERGEHAYTYFTTAGMNPNTPDGWERIKFEYGRIMSFLNNPTSTALGARQYVKYNAKSMDIPYEMANNIIDIATDPSIDEYGNVNIFSYGAILDKFRNDVMTVKREMNTDKEYYERDLEAKLQDAIHTLTSEQERIYQSYLKGFF